MNDRRSKDDRRGRHRCSQEEARRDFLELSNRAKQLGACTDRNMRRILLSARMSEGDPDVREVVEAGLHPWLVKDAVNPQPMLKNQPASQDVLDGSMPLADLENGLEWRIRPEMMKTHFLATGPTNSGKSYLFLWMAHLCMRAGMQVIWIDTKKLGRALLNWSDQITVLTPETFRFNFLVPPKGVKPDRWPSLLFEVFQQIDLRVATRGVFVSIVRQLYREYGVFEGSGRWPSPFELVEKLEQIPDRPHDKKSKYSQGGLNRIEGLIDMIGPDVFSVSRGHLRDIRDKRLSVVLEVEAPSDMVAVMTTIIVYGQYLRALAHNQSTQGIPPVVVFFDEGSLLFSRARQKALGALPYVLTETVMPRARGFLGLVIASQSAVSLAPSVIDNTWIKCLLGGGLGRPEDLKYFCQSMGLDAEMQRYMCDHPLEPGHLVFMDPRWGRPVEGRVKLIDPGEVVSDQRVQESFKRVEHLLNAVPRLNPDGTPWKPASQQWTETSEDEDAQSGERDESPGISRIARAILQDVVIHPYRPVMAHREAADVRSGAGGKAGLDELVREKLVLVHTIQVGRGREKALEGTEAGHDIVGMEKPPPSAKGGFKHDYIIHRFVVPFFEAKGFDVQVESDGADVVAHKPDTGELVPVEVELRDSTHVIENVRRDFRETGCDKLLIAVEKKKIQSQVRDRLDAAQDIDEQRDKVEVVLLSHFKT